jgi:hypothetical protein
LNLFEGRHFGLLKRNCPNYAMYSAITEGSTLL